MFEDYVPGQLQEVFNSPDTCEQLTPKSNETKKTKKKKKKEKDDESGKSKAKSTTEEEGGTQDGSELDGQVKERGKTTKKAESKSKNKKKGGRKLGKENGGGKSSVGGLQEERSSLSDKKDQGDDDNDDVEGLGSADTTNRETATESHKKKKKKQRKKQGKGNNEVKKKDTHLKRKEEEEEDDDDEDETNKKETMADQDPEAEASTIQKKKNKKDKNKKAKSSSNKDINERERRTIFVGNVPVSMKKAELRAIFKVFGFIESIRLRSIGFKDPSVPRMVTVALSKKQFHDRRHSMNAYVVFLEEKAAESALEANGHKVTAKVTNPSKRGGEEGGAVDEEEEEDFYLRVDRASGPKTSVDNSKSIFVGNLPYDAQENDVRRHFQGCGEIINVRLIRDRRLNVGKGFGYVSFRTKSAATTARLLHETEFRGRKLRVFASTDKPKKPASSSSPAPATGKKGRAAEKNRKGFERRTKKRKGISSDASDANKKHKFSGEYSSKKDAEARLKRKKKKQKHQQRKKKFLRNNSGQSNKRPRQKSNA